MIRFWNCRFTPRCTLLWALLSSAILAGCKSQITNPVFVRASHTNTVVVVPSGATLIATSSLPSFTITNPVSVTVTSAPPSIVIPKPEISLVVTGITLPSLSNYVTAILVSTNGICAASCEHIAGGCCEGERAHGCEHAPPAGCECKKGNGPHDVVIHHQDGSSTTVVLEAFRLLSEKLDKQQRTLNKLQKAIAGEKRQTTNAPDCKRCSGGGGCGGSGKDSEWLSGANAIALLSLVVAALTYFVSKKLNAEKERAETEEKRMQTSLAQTELLSRISYWLIRYYHLNDRIVARQSQGGLSAAQTKEADYLKAKFDGRIEELNKVREAAVQQLDHLNDDVEMADKGKAYYQDLLRKLLQAATVQKEAHEFEMLKFEERVNKL